ncbi:MmcQ/YjbR family DNA-binding protein [Paenibacillus sp. CC-CFT747]|nr:MmcQ/YjbR family DNA-binding protein [Paenibacillus sp. CC-CFT747]
MFQTAGHEIARRIALSLPEVVEGTSYRTPAFKVGDKLIARFHQDGETLVLRMKEETREIWLMTRPEAFYLTEHYRNYDYILARLPVVSEQDLEEAIRNAWRETAPKGLRENSAGNFSGE